ncbi:cytochrome c oxidase assembly factor 1 homolog [Asterias amurensis]|uniref:cytochrome c oxidase assembly factor 1 homolog n=1 Tax=Asterias amurensis TaxID=7602 RepID=UPI003AB4D4B0
MGFTSLPTLGKIAVYGGVLSAFGSGYFYKRIQEKLASGSYYSQSMKILRQHPGAAEILGHPIRSKFLDLGDKFNVVSATEANIAIPVKGKNRKGTLYTWSTRQGEDWEVKKIQLKLKDTENKVTIFSVGTHGQEEDGDNQDTSAELLES